MYLIQSFHMLQTTQPSNMNQNEFNTPHSRESHESPFLKVGETRSAYEAMLDLAKGKAPSEAPPAKSANTYTPQHSALSTAQHIAPESWTLWTQWTQSEWTHQILCNANKAARVNGRNPSSPASVFQVFHVCVFLHICWQPTDCLCLCSYCPGSKHF